MESYRETLKPMSKVETILRYHLIIKKVRKFPASFGEIEKYLKIESEMQGYDLCRSKRTFERDLNDIRSIYHIDIQYDASRNVYHIDYDAQPEAYDRILEAFDTFNALNISERLSDFIHFEKRHSKGTENLYGVLHAIKNGFQIKFSHQKYWDEEATEREAEPYALKEFRYRWYLVAKDLKDDSIKSFGLDRIDNLEITKKRFTLSANVNVREMFLHSFGVIGSKGVEPQEVVLSFEPFQGKYIKSLPLHESQQVLEDNEEELRVKLKLCITHDFLMELLSYGETVQVLQPSSLIEEIKNTYHNALKQYEINPTQGN